MSHFSIWIDGPIIGIYLLISMAAGIFVRKYVGRVEHFLVAGREMNVFLGIASLAATEFGIVRTVDLLLLPEMEQQLGRGGRDCHRRDFSDRIPDHSKDRRNEGICAQNG